MAGRRPSDGTTTASATVHLGRFRRDAARWVRPEQVASPDEVTPRRLLTMLLRHRPLRAMAWFRFASWAKEVGIVGVTGTVQRRIAHVYGLEISPGADIGGGLYIAHPVGTTISVERLGCDVSIIASATIGRRSSRRWPRIGDRVYIGAGARILGDIDVGEDAKIGANAVVLSDVAPGSTVVGIPARPVTDARTVT